MHGKAPRRATRRGAAGGRVYFNEYNILMENAAYLPLVSGLLRAYAETFEPLKRHYRFMPFLYHVDAPAAILARYEEPAVAAFSLSMWNEQLSLTVAAEVKRRFPSCLIVFGGPQVPQLAAQYFDAHPFVDVAVRAEGEEPFARILERLLDAPDFTGLPGISWRDPGTGRCVRNAAETVQPRDLDMYPSPYLEGLFDDIMRDSHGRQMQAIIETNRGCPFPCSFCYWGQGGLSRKYRYHGIDRVRQELEWCAKNRIRYVFNADSNFGMHRRDEEIADILVDIKRRYGFPEKFRTCFGKNTDERIFRIASRLHAAEMEKGITLALQSNDEQVLANVQRQNIKLSTYRDLQHRFNETDVPVYSELILGLPGETFESWAAGIEALLRAGLRNQLFIYLCQVYPNTEMVEPEYQRRHGIVTRRIELNEIHGLARPAGQVPEYEDVIVATNSMPRDMWRRMLVFSWLTMVLHSMKAGFFVLLYVVHRLGGSFADFLADLADLEQARVPPGTMLYDELLQYREKAQAILNGGGRGRVMPEYGAIYWDEEEAGFLRISKDPDRFYDELHAIVRQHLASRGLACDDAELRQVLRYQRLRFPTPQDPAVRTELFDCNVAEYFDRIQSGSPVPLRPLRQQVRFHAREFAGDRQRYARETILWGRKSGTIMTRADWIHEPRNEPQRALQA